MLGQCSNLHMLVHFQTVIPEGVDLNGFADDHNVKKSFGPGNKGEEEAVISVLESCTTKINE